MRKMVKSLHSFLQKNIQWIKFRVQISPLSRSSTWNKIFFLFHSLRTFTSFLLKEFFQVISYLYTVYLIPPKFTITSKGTKNKISKSHMENVSWVCWPLLSLCHLFMIFWGMSGVEPRALATHLSQTYPPAWYSYIARMSLFCFYFVGGDWLVMYLDLLKDCIVKNVSPNSQKLYLTTPL
jgi:hypothetical protein